MSENATPEERTEMPTEKRMQQVAERGQLYVATDLVQVCTLFVGFVILYLVWGWVYENMQHAMRLSFGLISRREPLTEFEALELSHDLFVKVTPPLLIMMVTIAAVAVAVTGLQTNWNIKKKLIDVKFQMLNPINGVKRIFSVQGIMNTVKAIAKLAVMLPIGFFALKGFAPEMVKLVHLQITDIMGFVGVAMMEIFWKIFYLLLVLAIIDYFWGKHQWLKQNKMTKNEVKDERKAIEGDEATKRRIVQTGMSRLLKKIQQSVPRADVIITNPTHYAVALQYDRATMRAPRVVAKGADFLALRIKELGRQHGVPVIERKVLARALYHSTRVGAEIPYDLFKAVAEVLAYVYRIRGKTASSSSMGSAAEGGR